jgi:hypothetical protein
MHVRWHEICAPLARSDRLTAQGKVLRRMSDSSKRPGIAAVKNQPEGEGFDDFLRVTALDHRKP